MTGSADTPDLGLFLHALASEFDAQAGSGARDVLLRAVGHRMAERMVPPPCQTLQALEIELNDLLARLGWGRTRLEVLRDQQSLRFVHDGLPRLGALGVPAGHWLQATLEGLYEGWISGQPDAIERYVVVREPPRDPPVAGQVVLILQARR